MIGATSDVGPYEVRTMLTGSDGFALIVHDNSLVVDFPVAYSGLYLLALDLGDQLNAAPGDLPMSIWDPDFAEKNGMLPDFSFGEHYGLYDERW